MQTIVVGYDETAPSKRALERAANIAQAFDSKIVVTSVAPLLHSSPRSAASGPVDPTDSLAVHVEELRHAAEYLESRGVTPELVPAIGEPAAAIVKLAEERDADLVVVGTREPGIIDRLMRHSVSRQVAKHVRRDLLIVHPEH